MFERHASPKFFSRLGRRWSAWRYRLGAVSYKFNPNREPHTIGDYDIGMRLSYGSYQDSGLAVQLGRKTIWDIRNATLLHKEDLQGFRWLDDLAAVGDAKAAGVAQQWTRLWLKRFGKGRGVGWAADLVARRAMRLLNHAAFLMTGEGAIAADELARTIHQHGRFLAKYHTRAKSGLPKFEALTGLIVLGLELNYPPKQMDEVIATLSAACRNDINPEGGIATRNAEVLLEIFTLLGWVKRAFDEKGLTVPGDVIQALDRIAPNLRSLRLSDGALCRFHGGGRGMKWQLDRALANAQTRAEPPKEFAMGYARLSSGATSLIVDAAPPPIGEEGSMSHASATAIELTHGRCPIIVNCGSGVGFGSDLRQRSRSTASHSTLGIDGVSSAEIRKTSGQRRHSLTRGAQAMPTKRTRAIDGLRLQVAQDGYRPDFGMVHGRTLDLTHDGRGLFGEDVISVQGPVDVAQFQKAKAKLGGAIGLSVRFHIHPDIDAETAEDASSVYLITSLGDRWVFTCKEGATLALDSSVYLEQGQAAPRTCDQIVLSLALSEPTARIVWSLAKG